MLSLRLRQLEFWSLKSHLFIERELKRVSFRAFFSTNSFANSLQQFLNKILCSLSFQVTVKYRSRVGVGAYIQLSGLWDVLGTC